MRNIILGRTLLLAALAMSAGCSGTAASGDAAAPDTAAPEAAATESGEAPREPFGAILSLIPGAEIRSGGGGFLVTRLHRRNVAFDSSGLALDVPAFESASEVRFYASALGLYATGTTGASGLQDGGRVLARVADDGSLMWSVPEQDGFHVGDTSIEVMTGESYLPVDAETGQVRAGATPGASPLADEVRVEKDADALAVFRGEQRLWAIQTGAEIKAAGYGRLALYNSGSGDIVLLDLEDGSQQNVLPTDSGDLTGCNQAAAFVTENILALQCHAGAGTSHTALVRV